jgi:2,4-dienoyl-CoA reductase-like NADH-dependent reductase (Old Yellow Enzyme family)
MAVCQCDASVVNRMVSYLGLMITSQPLLQSHRLGELSLTNQIVMASLTGSKPETLFSRPTGAEYGGSIINRARFLFEITETVLKYVEPGRVGIKVGPMNLSGPFAAGC